MKKIILLTTTLLAVSTTAMAEKDGEHRNGKGYSQQGFFDESAAVKSVAAALKAADDTPALLEGKIVRQIDEDDFIFQDATGEIEIDVSRNAWNGQTITPQETVQLRGKVDKEWNNVSLDIKQITKK